MKNPFSVLIPIFAMIIIAVLEVVAIANELNGTVLAGALALIAGLGGYTVGKYLKPK